MNFLSNCTSLQTAARLFYMDWKFTEAQLSGNSDTKVVFCHLNMIDAISHHRKCRKPSFTGYQPVIYRISQRGHTFSLFVICFLFCSAQTETTSSFFPAVTPILTSFNRIAQSSKSWIGLMSQFITCHNKNPKLNTLLGNQNKHLVWEQTYPILNLV